MPVTPTPATTPAPTPAPAPTPEPGPASTDGLAPMDGSAPADAPAPADGAAPIGASARSTGRAPRSAARARLRRRLLLWTAGVLAAGACCAGAYALVARHVDAAPRPITLDEAQTLALARFTAYEKSPVAVVAHVPYDSDTTIVRGLVDYRSHKAVGSYVSGPGAGTATGLLAWDQGGLAVSPADTPPAGPPPAPLTDPTRIAGAADGAAPTAWSPRAYTSDPLDTALRMVMSLGTAQPENPQLLAQAGPRRLREETVDGIRYTVFSGPRPRGAKAGTESPLTYWVSADGRLGHVEARLPSLAGPLRLDFAEAPRSLKVPTKPWGTVGRK
ncbi:hypothetical protein ACN20G_31455 (plasmid) [Streptomyces sp. BI20]|uniref:hypothetical protein n=1 Tax=Streptomyces sp. BI20 TaxID=3403460 RepID=UPI003C749BCE